MNIKTKTLLLLIASIIAFGFTNKNKEKFIGESKLRDCEIEITLDYSTKGQEELQKSVNKYKDVEIVLVTSLKKGKASYCYYYLVGYKGSYGPSAFLVKSNKYNSESNTKHGLFLNYKPKKHTFYKADCFKRKLANDKKSTRRKIINAPPNARL